MESDAFAARYAVEIFETGGVVIDLETGNYFRVDHKAAIACAALAKGDFESGVDEVAKRLQIPRAHAYRVVIDTRSALDAAPLLGTPTGPYHYYPEENGFGLWHANKRVLLVKGANHEIHVPRDQGIEQSPLLEFYVRGLAPKIMFIRGVSVLHASACAAKGTVVAFAGLSGAGKTTTARAFVGVGARPICEDLLVLKANAARPSVVLDGEARVHAWAKSVTDRLAAGDASASSTDLATMADGPGETVHILHFLDVTRRKGTEFDTRALSEPDGLLALMANNFLGDSSPESWRRYFQLARAIAGGLKLLEVTTPAGLDALGPAAQRYMSTWTS